MKRTGRLATVLTVVALSCGGCAGQIAGAANPMAQLPFWQPYDGKAVAASLRKDWNRYLERGIDRESNYDAIYVSDDITSVKGFSLWQGTYRGVPIALYSCRLASLMPLGQATTLKEVSIILAVEQDDIPPNQNTFYRRCMVRSVAEQRFGFSEVDIDRFPELRPQKGVATRFNIGAVALTLRDDGDGKMAFQVNFLKKPRWDVFELETVLKPYDMAGPAKIESPPVPSYTPEAFAKVMVERLGKFEQSLAYGEWWCAAPRSREMATVEHPLWRDPAAVKALLAAAPERELVYALNVMRTRAWKDPSYPTRLQCLAPDLLKLAEHQSPAVRGAFRSYLVASEFWPADPAVLEPFLNVSDADLLSVTLGLFWKRGHVPQNMVRVRELMKHEDDSVRYRAELLLEMAKKQKK